MGINLKTILAPLLILVIALFAPSVLAHCPLCTVGAAAAAGGAAYLGVNQAAIGIFIGAFAVSMGWWFSNLIKKKIHFKRSGLIAFSFATTIFPLLPLFKDFHPLYISFLGFSYGSFLNRVYLINLFLVGAIVGGFIVSIAPLLSNKITKLRNGKMMPYQGMVLMALMLIVSSLLLQFLL